MSAKERCESEARVSSEAMTEKAKTETERDIEMEAETESETETSESLPEKDPLSEGVKFLISDIELSHLEESARRDVHILLADGHGAWKLNDGLCRYFEISRHRDGKGGWNFSTTKGNPSYYTNFPYTWDYYANGTEVMAEIIGWMEYEIPDGDAFLQRRKKQLFETYICQQALGYIAELYEDANGTVEGVLCGDVHILTDPFDDPYLMEAEVWYCLKNREPVKATLKFDREGPFKLLSVTIDEDAVYSESEVKKAIVTLHCEFTIDLRLNKDGISE